MKKIKIKRKTILSRATTWMNCEDIMLSKVGGQKDRQTAPLLNRPAVMTAGLGGHFWNLLAAGNGLWGFLNAKADNCPDSVPA